MSAGSHRSPGPRSTGGARTARIGILLTLPVDAELCRTFVADLRALGHHATAAASGEELLVGAPYDLIVVDADLPGQWSGLGLLEALREPSTAPVALLVGEEPGFETLREAMRLGVRDFLRRPLDADKLLTAALRALGQGRDPALFTRVLPVAETSVASGARLLSAFLVERGVVPSHRVRVASAVAEVLHVACRGASDPEQERRVTLRARAESGQVWVEVEIHGVPLAVLALLPPGLPGFPALDGELSRARCLSDVFEVHPTPGGSRVRLSFDLAPVRFDEEHDELAEAEFLHPDVTRRLLTRIARQNAAVQLPPSLTTAIGRLLQAEPRSTALASSASKH